MKKRNSGCCFLFLCLLFLLPGLILIKDRLPDQETIKKHGEDLHQQIHHLVNGVKVPKKESEEEKQELLTSGQGSNGCSYYYWLLDEESRAEYMKILDGLQDMKEEIDLFLDEEETVKIVKMVLADHPELFWTEASYHYTVYKDWIRLKPVYTCSPEEKEERAVAVEATVQEALQSIPEGLSSYEHIKTLFSYVVNTVSYDLNAPDNQNIYSSMVNRVSVCTGYAKELQYLLQRDGIQALLVEGEVVDRGPHAWIIVLCDGKYYHVDPTFGDPSYTEDSMESMDSLPAELQVDYAFLCCDDQEISRDRSISRELELPVCDSRDLLYYPMHGTCFDSYGEEVLVSLQDSLERGENFWEGQFTNEEAFETMIAKMQDGVYANLVLANNPYMESVLCRMSYRTESRVVKMWYEQ